MLIATSLFYFDLRIRKERVRPAVPDGSGSAAGAAAEQRPAPRFCDARPGCDPGGDCRSRRRPRWRGRSGARRGARDSRGSRGATAGQLGNWRRRAGPSRCPRLRRASYSDPPRTGLRREEAAKWLEHVADELDPKATAGPDPAAAQAALSRILKQSIFRGLAPPSAWGAVQTAGNRLGTGAVRRFVSGIARASGRRLPGVLDRGGSAERLAGAASCTLVAPRLDRLGTDPGRL